MYIAIRGARATIVANIDDAMGDDGPTEHGRWISGTTIIDIGDDTNTCSYLIYRFGDSYLVQPMIGDASVDDVIDLPGGPVSVDELKIIGVAVREHGEL